MDLQHATNGHQTSLPERMRFVFPNDLVRLQVAAMLDESTTLAPPLCPSAAPDTSTHRLRPGVSAADTGWQPPGGVM